jgi:pilus assembly protein CpaF
MTIRIITADGVREVNLPAAGSISIGRLPESGLRLDSKSVSRRHAELSVKNGVVTLTDVGSSRGTLLNGEKVAPGKGVRIAQGDEIRIGDFRLVVPHADVVAPVPAASESAFSSAYADTVLLYADGMLSLQKKIHAIILSRLNAGAKAANLAADRDLAQRAEKCLDEVLRELRHEIPETVDQVLFRQALVDELLGYGPIAPMLRDPAVTEIMVNGPDRVFVESKGVLHETGARFMNEGHLVQLIKRIVEPIGRHVDDASPMVDARLPDGSRVNAIIPPLALDGASLTIRKFADKKLTTDDLIAFGSMTVEMAAFLAEAVRQRQNILVSGGTGSGKTTLLNILSQFIPERERLVTIEDSAELKLSHRNIVRLEARPANIEGKGRVAIRDLVVNALRMRPDRIIVGECRGAEALDMLQAMNTGHDGSLTTAHANNPRDAMSRLENMVMMAGYELPSSAIREQIASAINIVVQQSRLADGSRKIVKVVEVTGREGDVIQMQDIFEYRQTGFDDQGRIQGYYSATGNIPYFIDELRQRGVLALDMSIFVPKV